VYLKRLTYDLLQWRLWKNPASRILHHAVAEHIDDETHEESTSESVSSASELFTMEVTEQEEVALVPDDAKRWVDKG